MATRHRPAATMRLQRTFLLIVLLFPFLAHAQLDVTISPVKIVGQKAVVPLALKNNFTETIQSARAVAFLFDADGKMLGQSTKWAIGGDGNKPGLTAGSTNAFNF